MTDPQINDPIVNRHVAIGLIDDHPDNDNEHPEEQIEELRASLRIFGQGESIAVQAPAQEGGRYLCVAGHGVKEAANLEGFTHLRCDVFPADWPPQKIKAYLVAANRLGTKSRRNDAQTSAILAEIKESDPDLLPATGWTDSEIEDLFAQLEFEPPSLEDLAQEFGDHNEEDMWPVLTIKVSPDVKDRYETIMASIPGTDDSRRFGLLLDCVDVAALAQAGDLAYEDEAK